MRCKLCLSVLLLTLTCCCCALQQSDPRNSLEIGARLRAVESDMKGEPISEVANWCLHIAEKRDIETGTRVAAVCRIAELGERGTVPRLLRMLPGDYDAITFEVINALGSLKDPRAAPVLDRMLSNRERNGFIVPGKIRAAAAMALTECIDTRKVGA